MLVTSYRVPKFLHICRPPKIMPNIRVVARHAERAYDVKNTQEANLGMKVPPVSRYGLPITNGLLVCGRQIRNATFSNEIRKIDSFGRTAAKSKNVDGVITLVVRFDQIIVH